MSNVLVAYSSNSGSTKEVADAIAGELTLSGHAVEVRPLGEVTHLSHYEAVVLGAPMIFGWHQPVRRFIRYHSGELAGKKVAYFACAMRLTRTQKDDLSGISLFLDPNLVSDPVKRGALSIKERFTTLENYLKPMLRSAPSVKPLSLAFFYGKLEMFRLKWWQSVFVMLVVQAVPGDYRDWDCIKSWGRSLAILLS